MAHPATSQTGRADRYYVYTYPAKKALRAIMAKVKTACRAMDTNQP
jgi:RNA-directed DNA polymerase